MKLYLVKIIEDGVFYECIEIVFKESYCILLKQENIDFIKCVMVGVVKEGMGVVVFWGVFYELGGKIGMVQVVNIVKNQKYDFKKFLCIYYDNGFYIGFVLVDVLCIVIVVVVENGGWGVGVVVLLVCKVMDYFMLGKCFNELIKLVVFEVVSLDILVEGFIFEDVGSSNMLMVQLDVQE